LTLTVIATLFATSAVAEEGPIRLGVLTDMSSLYTDNGGRGSVVAAQMAVDDFGGEVLGRKVEVISGDHQNKADVGAAIARRWLDNEKVELILDVPNSAVALAVQEITRQKKKVFIPTGAATSRLTGDECSMTGIHWTYDTYALSQGTTKAIARLGAKKWFFLSADYSLGSQLEADSRKVIDATGGRVVGSVKHPVNTADFSSFLLQAQSSNADVIALADAGGDFINAVKQAGEFGLTKQQKLVGLLVFIADIHSLGLQSAQGLMLSSAFYWDLNDETRAWSRRFIDKTQKVPTMNHAGTYGAVMHYLKAVQAVGTLDGPTVAAKMREMPVNDFMTKNGKIRADGRLVRDMYLFQVKTPEESKYKYDYYKLLATIPGEEAFRPMEEGGCPLLSKN
jgi:branched-chain amino acid transport system substrate-binding protein